MSDNKFTGGDDRLKKSTATPVRGDRVEADASRTQTDGTATTLEERRRMIRSEWAQDVLPNPPKVEGWHYCWLSTSNSTDPIYKRMQKGYVPVKVNEIPGFSQYTVNEGEFEGCVACNEMLLFKIEEELYQEIMNVFHYERPMEEEEILRANAAENISQQDSNGKNLGQVEGFDSLARRVRPAHFA
jgi:hypothetical protein